MPTYDYACKGCGHRFERFESINDDAAKPCPKCGKKQARRMLGTGVGLIFRGSGFYTTDYKGAGKGSGKGSGEGTGEGASSKEGESKKPAKDKKEEKERKK